MMWLGLRTRPKRVRRNYVLVVVAMCLVSGFSSLTMAASARPAGAAFNPCTAYGSNFAGRNTYVAYNAFEGIGANLTYQSDALCTSYLGNDNLATTWSMASGNDEKGWSQSGQIYFYSLGCAAHFGEQEENADYFMPALILGVCASTGEIHWVWQQYLPDSGHMRSNIDQTVMLETGYSVFAPEGNYAGSGWGQPFQVEVEGETKYRETDVPGTTSQPSDFTGMEVQRWSDDNWETTCNGNASFRSSTSLARYSDYPPSCDHVQVWTNNPYGY